MWRPLYDPRTPDYHSMDLAFVITPEPASLALLGVSALLLKVKRRSAGH
jgi:hypothetical protein